MHTCFCVLHIQIWRLFKLKLLFVVVVLLFFLHPFHSVFYILCCFIDFFVVFLLMNEIN